MNGHIFDIGTTQAYRYIKTKKDMVGYFGSTYSNLTKKSIETITYKLASIVGPVMPTKQFTEHITNVVTTVDKLETDITYLEKLDINEETLSNNKEKREYKKEMLKVYDIIHAQCNDAIIQELQTYSFYEAVFGASDSVELLKLIKLICYTYQVKHTQTSGPHQGREDIHHVSPSYWRENISYLDIFENMHTVYTTSGGEVSGTGMIAYEMGQPRRSHAAGTGFNSLSIAQQDAFRAWDRLAYISTLKKNANQKRYGDLKTQLSNDYIMGASKFPANIQEAQHLWTTM